MPTTGQMGANAAGWIYEHDVTAAGEKTISLKTENKFVDSDINIKITTPAASAPTLDLTDKTTTIDMGTASSGVYSPAVDLSGNINITTGGWINSGNHTVTDAGVVVGKVNQSTIQNGSTPIASGATITPSDSSQIITISEGYNAARTLIIGAADSSAAGSVTSGSATIDSVTYSYNSTNDNFNIAGSANVTAPTVDSPGYISTIKGERNANVNGAVVATTVDKIILKSTLTGATSARKPSISKNAISISGVTDAASGNAQTTAPSSGVYVAVKSAANTATITASPSVKTAGYGDTTNYGKDIDATATVGAAASDVTYVPIKAGTVTSGSGAISDIAVNYNSTSSNFQVTGSADISAPTFTEGYIASSVGTKNVNPGGATVTASLNKIGITASISGTGTKQPTITKNAATNIPQAGAATTTAPDSGYYIAVSSAANTGTVNAVPTVSSAGYGTTTAGQYTATNSNNFIVGAAASATTYIPISQASFANTATSGVTYTDISSTAPALISGDFLYINAGYTTNQKISLAKLVPDAAGVNATADYILSGYTAYNNEGALITGNIQTYAGDYEII